jgi:hypothetical protein
MSTFAKCSAHKEKDMRISYYHATDYYVDVVMDFPLAKPALHGHGFYVSLTKEGAAPYGKRIIEFVMDKEFDAPIRPINKAYLDDMSLLEECMRDGMEVVLTQAQATGMALDAIEIIVH